MWMGLINLLGTDDGPDELSNSLTLVQQGREQKGEKDCSGDAVGGKDEWKTKANEYKNKNKHTKY